MEQSKNDLSENPKFINGQPPVSNENVDWEMIGKRILTRRISLNMSQEELADLLKTSKQNISKYENGVIKSTKPEILAMILKFAHALSCSIEFLKGTVNQPNQLLIDKNGKILSPESFSFLTKERQDEFQKQYNKKQSLKLEKYRALKGRLFKKLKTRNIVNTERLSEPKLCIQADNNGDFIVYDPLYPEKGYSHLGNIKHFMEAQHNEVFIDHRSEMRALLNETMSDKFGDYKLIKLFLQNYSKLDSAFIETCLKINEVLPNKKPDDFDKLKKSLESILKKTIGDKTL